MKKLSEAWGSEVKFTKSLSLDLTNLNKITQLVGLPKIIKAQAEFQIPGGFIDVVGFTSKGHAVVFEHQDQSGKADQTHVNKTIGYPVQLRLQGYTVLGSILLCESVDKHYVDQFTVERFYYLANRKSGHKNLHIVKSQWTDDLIYEPVLFEDTTIIKSKDAWKIDNFSEFIELYAREWTIVGEETRPTTKTLWFRDVSKARHYIHHTQKLIKVGLHFENPSESEKALVTLHGGRHSKHRSTIEYELPLGSEMYKWWINAETLKQSIRKGLKTICEPTNNLL